MAHETEKVGSLAVTAGSAPSLAQEAAQLLEKIRRDKQPTKRGIMLCGQMMGEMLRLGWKRDQLDSLEILYWSLRDGNGELIKRPSLQNSISGEKSG